LFKPKNFLEYETPIKINIKQIKRVKNIAVDGLMMFNDSIFPF
jgi:hypothetical protein